MLCSVFFLNSARLSNKKNVLTLLFIFDLLAGFMFNRISLFALFFLDFVTHKMRQNVCLAEFLIFVTH